ncbi:MAG: hypothetical protein JWM99_3897 [Verrucomicrobiales bacterium]|nr:hypothetical protein [Verrucomicrobiales bacterium]
MWRLHTFILVSLLTLHAQPLQEELQFEYTAGSWSKPVPVILPSATGPVPGLKKTTSIQRTNPRYSEQYALDIVSSGKLSNLVAPPADKYLVIGGRICGLYAERASLKFRFAPLDSGEAPQRLLEETVSKLVRDPRSAFDRGEEVYRFDLTYVFGSDFFGPHEDARGPIHWVILTGAYFQNGNLVINLSNKLHPAMTVTIDPKMNLIAASDGGSDLMLLRSGRLSSPPSAWGRPRTASLRDSNKDLQVPRCGAFVDVPGQPEGQGTYKAEAVWCPDGKLWFGDGDCRLAAFGGGIVGAKVGANATLLLNFSKSVLPHEPGAVIVFEEKLSEFSSAISRGRFPEEIKIDLTALFPNLPIVNDPDLEVRSVRINDDKLEITIRTNNNRVQLFVVVDSKFSVTLSKAGLFAH